MVPTAILPTRARLYGFRVMCMSSPAGWPTWPRLVFMALGIALWSAAIGAEPSVVSIDGQRIQASGPGRCKLAESEEQSRAGSVIAYHIRNCQEISQWNPDDLTRLMAAELQFHTEESIRRFDEACRKRTGFPQDGSCFEGWRPSIEDLRREREALTGKALERVCSGYAPCGIRDNGGLRYLVRGSPLGNSATLRLLEYITFFGAVRASANFVLPREDPKLRRLADQMVKQMGLSSAP